MPIEIRPIRPNDTFRNFEYPITFLEMYRVTSFELAWVMYSGTRTIRREYTVDARGNYEFRC